LLTLEAESLGIPDTEYPTKIRMSSSEFTRVCKELTALAETVRIEVDGKIALFSFSGKSGSGKITLKSNNAEKTDDQIFIECNEKVMSSYGLQYLNSFAKASSLSTTVSLNLSSSFPLMIEYDIENKGFVKFYLAPKMDDETN
jgi:proliferating cell nuclear antigen